MTAVEYLTYSLMGICVVFFALILLMVIIKVMTALKLSDEPKGAKADAVAASPSPGNGQAALAPGSAGEVKLHGTDPRDAAMIMAIVADELGLPINELRFVSIREIAPASN